MLRRLAAGAISLATLTATPVLAQDTAPDFVTDYTLDNGMQVVVIEDHRAPVVVQMVWYRAGSADEAPGVSGIAHFLEHLMFKATDTLDAGEFSATVSQNGGTDNAFTSFDATAYFQRVAADRLPIMMEMEADRMVNLRLTEDEVKTERDVILEERSMRIDSDPQALLQEQMRAAQYLNHHYGIPVIGWRHEMEQLSREDALEWYRAYYAPNNATLIVAGDVQPEDVLALAQEHYGPIPANPDLPAERLRPQEPPQLAERRLTYSDPRIAQPYVTRSYLAPERDSGAQEKAAALTVLAQLLGGGQTGYLMNRLAFDEQLATYASAFYSGTSLDDTLFGVYVVPGPGVGLDQAETAMDKAIADFIEDGVEPEDLERIKMQVRAQNIYERDDVGSMARTYGSALTRGLTIADIQAWPDALQAVTEEDVLAVAREVLNRDNAVTAHVMTEEVAQ